MVGTSLEVGADAAAAAAARPPTPPRSRLQTPEGPPKKWDTKVNPLLLLDYRCHVDNGTIGTNLPPQV